MRGDCEPRKHILIVEDDSALARLYRTALSLEGFDVAVATDGLCALRHIDQQRPDLLVLDLHLPQLRGEAILKEVASRPELSTTPVIVVTGDDARVAIAQATAILRKPCAPDRLLSVIDLHLRAA